MIRNDDNPEISLLPFLISPITEARGQVQFCQNLIANIFEKGESPCTREFPNVKIKRQLLDHYLKGISSITSQYVIYIIEIRSPNAFHDRYLIQTDDVVIEFSKNFKQYNMHTTSKLNKRKLNNPNHTWRRSPKMVFSFT